MTLVFPLEKNTTDCIELKYALRSMQYLQPENVVIVGYRPPWLKNVVHVLYEQEKGLRNKHLNIYGKLHKAFIWASEFLYCNDDHFLNPGFDPFTNYFHGTISELLPIARQGYAEAIRHTIGFAKKDILNFDVHCPIYMHKADFEKNLSIDNFILPHGVLIKSMYARELEQKKEYPDCKITTPVFDPVRLQERLFFSCSDRALTKTFINFLERQFPIKSKYE